MMNKYIFLLAIALVGLTVGCKESDNDTAEQQPVTNPTLPDTSDLFFSVQATGQTESGHADTDADAMDDAAIWYNTADPEQSLILGANKKLGLEVYGLQGTRLQTDSVGRINNIDVRDGFDRKGEQIALVGASNRDNVGIDLWMINEQTLQAEYLTPGSLPSNLPDVYGFCLYQSQTSNLTYAFINSKSGAVEQWLLTYQNKKMTATLERTLKLQTQVEGMVADDHYGKLYVGEENKGIFVFDAEPQGSTEGTFIPLSGSENPAIRYDVEGLTIYLGENNTGYLIASSQGNNSYAVFDRTGTNEYLGSFEISEGTFDGTQETDGIDVSHHSFGSIYPNGFFIVQDGINTSSGSKTSQNFKMVDWKVIAEGLQK
ncbi:MAG: phytase [Leptolyngbya sp. SIO3F4]|nr:phytase [Leptolyngbya sp. SIO3F4]